MTCHHLTPEQFATATAIIAAAWGNDHNSPAIIIDVRLTTLLRA